MRMPLLFLILYALLPAPSHATTLLCDRELAAITGQAPGDAVPAPPVLQEDTPDGIFSLSGLFPDGPYNTIDLQFFLDITAGSDVIYYGNPEESAYASLTDVFFRMQFRTPDDGGVRITTGSFPSLLAPDGPEQTRLRVTLDRVSIKLLESRIGAIRIGNAPGEGNSLGALTFGPSETVISGTFEIWPNP